MSTSAIIRICVFGIAILAVMLLWQQLKGANPGLLLIFFIVVGVIGGLVAVKYLIPWIGDAMGTFMYSSGEQVTESEGMKAASKLAQGDYHGAISEYEKAAREKPQDSFPIAEIARIYAEKLDDPHKALEFLRGRIEGQEWEPDAAAFLMFRMVDIQLDKLKDYQQAHDLLEEIIGNFPNTRHSANARHKLNEVEQAQFKSVMEQRLKNTAQGA